MSRLPLAVRLGLTIPPPPRTGDPRSVYRGESRDRRASLRLQAPRKEAGGALGGGSSNAPCAPAAAWRLDSVSAAAPRPSRLLSGCLSSLRPAAVRRAISGAARWGGEGEGAFVKSDTRRGREGGSA